MIKGIIKKGEYYDSVSLMLVAKEINKMPGIEDSSVVMGTKENLAILKNAELLVSELEKAGDTDLIIVVKAQEEKLANDAINNVAALLKEMRNKKDKGDNFTPKSFDSALTLMPEANLSLISIAGKYAAAEAQKAIENNMHVMIFSDNVSIEDEFMLKQMADAKGLLVMGPDCGTAIINGIPLAFANVVNSGNIGLVGASGTGLQEVTSIISMNGGGISQAMGTGGRDVKREIGGIMFISALKALANNDKTKVICLVSKPPHAEVLQKIATVVKSITKPVVAIFIGADKELIEKSGAIAAESLEEAALFSVALAEGKAVDAVRVELTERNKEIQKLASEVAKNTKGKYLRGLFSGGTLCDEAQLILRKTIGNVYSNTPLHPDFKLQDVWKSKGHTILDLGDDEFTAGRPHPMIDFSLRTKRIVEEAKDKEVAIIMLDVVLGYGSNMHPDVELVPAITLAKEISPGLQVICAITGTDKDPQNLSKIKTALEKTGVIVMPSNVAAAELCGDIIQLLNK